MGVSGLLPCLQSITKHISLEKYRGLTAAVDAMCWLHKGVFTSEVVALAKYQFQEMQMNLERGVDEAESKCEDEDTEGEGSFVKKLSFDEYATVKKSRLSHCCEFSTNYEARLAMDKCVDYVIRHSENVRKQYGIELVLVIDGESLPSKDRTNEQRRMDRIEAFRRGLEAEGRGDKREARKQFSRACSVSHEIRHLLILQCKLRRIPFVVAPYEADAQLAKLAHVGIVDVVISEDSDLLAYACPRVLFKIDFKTGRGDEIQIMRDLASNDSLSFRNWSHDMFVYMCILAGCDYCEGIPGIGIKIAHKYVRIHRTPSKIFKALRAAGKLPVEFEDAFWMAYRTFRHQRVYCAQNRTIENLNPIQEKGDHNQMWEFLGSWIEPSKAIALAEGKIHPTHLIPWDEVEVLKKKTINDAFPKEYSSQQTKPNFIQNSAVGSHRIKRKSGRSEGSHSTNKDNLFSFFKIKKGETNNKTMNSNRQPLQEIHLSNNDCFNRSNIESIPSKPHDYTSNLVAKSFEPLSRNPCSNRLLEKRKSASRAIRKLKNKLSLKKVLEKQAQQNERLRIQLLQEPTGEEALECQGVDDLFQMNMEPSRNSHANLVSSADGKLNNWFPFHSNKASDPKINYDENNHDGDVFDASSIARFDYGPSSDTAIDKYNVSEALSSHFPTTVEANLYNHAYQNNGDERNFYSGTEASQYKYFGVPIQGEHSHIDSENRQDSQIIDTSFEVMDLDNVGSSRSFYAGSDIPRLPCHWGQEFDSFDYGDDDVGVNNEIIADESNSGRNNLGHECDDHHITTREQFEKINAFQYL